jgi:MFS family permease
VCIAWFQSGWLLQTVTCAHTASQHGTAASTPFVCSLLPPHGCCCCCCCRFGHIGDVYGRRITLLLSILLITLPTVLIGCLPSYKMIGIAAPVLLAVFRFVQGTALLLVVDCINLVWHGVVHDCTAAPVCWLCSDSCKAALLLVVFYFSTILEPGATGCGIGLAQLHMHSHQWSDVHIFAQGCVTLQQRVYCSKCIAMAGVCVCSINRLRIRHITPLLFPLPSQTRSTLTWVKQSQTWVKLGSNLCQANSSFVQIMTLFAGLAVGGEFGSCIVYLYEIAPKRKRGLFSSFGQASIVSVHECYVPLSGRSTAGGAAAVAAAAYCCFGTPLDCRIHSKSSPYRSHMCSTVLL